MQSLTVDKVAGAIKQLMAKTEPAPSPAAAAPKVIPPLPPIAKKSPPAI